VNPEVEALLKKAKRSQNATESQDRRNIGDYSVLAQVTKEEVLEMLAWAKEFIKAAENYLKQLF
jgi:uncharacterized protein (UPF0332 family)